MWTQIHINAARWFLINIQYFHQSYTPELATVIMWFLDHLYRRDNNPDFSPAFYTNFIFNQILTSYFK